MYAVFHPPNFPVQAASRTRPDLRKRPFALLHGDPPAEVVFAANKAARSLGIEIGMARLQAESFPGVVTLPRLLDHERSADTILNAIACTFSPRIEYVETHPGTYALDIQGMTSLYGDEVQLATKMRQRIMSAGLLANVAVSHNFHVALCLASRKSGVSIVPPGHEAVAMRDLDLGVLNLEPMHEQTLRSWGVRTCGELAAFPESDLIARIGQAGKRLHSLSRGDWSHLMFPIEPSFEESLVEHIELEFPVEILESLLFLLRRMTDVILDRAKSKARAIASLQLVLSLNGGKHHERIVRPALPLQDTATLLKLLQLDLETHPPSAAIVGLELRAQSAAPHRAQHGLFLPQAPEPGRLEVLLARMGKLLGEQRVGSPELIDDYRPTAFRMVPFAPPPPVRSATSSLPVSTALRISRPLQVIGVVLSGNRPTAVFWDRQKYVVRGCAGPWRVSGQWWSEAVWSREEWDVQLATGVAVRVCRIAFDPRSRSWYVQGTYD